MLGFLGQQLFQNMNRFLNMMQAAINSIVNFGKHQGLIPTTNVIVTDKLNLPIIVLIIGFQKLQIEQNTIH